MARSRSAPALLLAALLLPPAAVGQAAASAGSASDPSGRFLSRGLVVLSPHADPLAGALRFRFLPDGAWARCERDLELSAVEGEDRLYRLELEDAAGIRRTLEYRIDRRRPAPPSAEPAGGLFDRAVAPALAAESGAAIRWTLFSPGNQPAAFSPYGEASRPSLAMPQWGTATYTLLAYSEDEAGNRSGPARFVYRLAAKGLPLEAAAPGKPAIAVLPDPRVAPPRIERRAGAVDLLFFLPEGTSLLTAVGVDETPERLDDFARTEPAAGIARLSLECPYGWSGRLRVHYGTFSEGTALRAPEPLLVDLDCPIVDSSPPPAPDAPIVASDAAGRGSFLIFPTYDGKLFVSLDGMPPVSYAGPIFLDPALASATVAWYGEGPRGLRSATGTLRLSLPPALPEAGLEGIEDGAVSGGAIKLLPTAAGVLRYELSSGPADGSTETPREPTVKSALVGEGLSFDCPPGEERWFALRYRAFAGISPEAPAGDTSLIRFAIDRRPPESPRPLKAPPAYADRSVSIDFDRGEAGTRLYVSVAADGARSSFEPCEGPIALPGSDLGPTSYLVKAYHEDAAGNRSPEMPPLAVVVDLSSVYAADDARDSGDGSPSRPFRSFDEAVAAALAAGKRSVNIRGTFAMTRPVAASSDLRLVGGFGPDWARDGARRARIDVAAMAKGGAFAARGAKLTFKDLDLFLVSSKPDPLIRIEDGSLAISDCAISAEGPGDLLLIAAANSSVEVDRSVIEAARAMSCALFRAEGSALALRDSVIAARAAVRTFTAIDLQGGALVLERSLVESSADLALCMLSLRGAAITLDRSILKADAGSGYLRVGDFRDVGGEIRNSRILVDWNGDGVLFETAGRSPAFRHLTMSAGTKRGRLDCFSSSGGAPQLWNSILSFATGGGTMLRTDTALRAGQLVSNCIWGFEELVQGASTASSLSELDAFNAADPAYASRRQLSEPPSATFAAPVKSLSPLSRSSVCVDAALPLAGDEYSLDFKGLPRPAAWGRRLPDIGADEAAE